MREEEILLRSLPGAPHRLSGDHLSSLFLILIACAAEPAPALQTTTCNQPGPIQVLAAPLGTSTDVVGEAAGRWLVRTDVVGEHHFTSVGPCGEDPQPFTEAGEVVAGDGRFWVVQGLDPTVDPADLDPADEPMMPRVGVWPAQGGPVTWVAEAEGDIPLGLVPGHGYLVLQREPGAGIGEAVIVGPDGARQLVWSDVVVDDTIVQTDPESRAVHDDRFQHVAGVFAYLDGRSELRVTQADAIGTVHTVEDVATFALGPDDASWFITRVVANEPSDQSHILQNRSDGLLHVRGTVETFALGVTEAWPGLVHPGWVLLTGQVGMPRGIFAVSSRMEVVSPEGIGPYHADAQGRLYGQVDGVVRRWDPSTGVVEDLAQVADDFGNGLGSFVAHEAAAMGIDSHGDGMLAIPTSPTNADVTVAPFDGTDPWTVPERTDAVGLLPDGNVVYTPAADGGPLDVGPLLWVDRHGDPRRIDDAVKLLGSPWAPQIVDGDLVFQVADIDRAGLWRATLP